VLDLLKFVLRIWLAILSAIARVAQQIWNAWHSVDTAAAIVAAVMIVVAVLTRNALCELGALGAVLCLSVAAFRRERWNLVDEFVQFGRVAWDGFRNGRYRSHVGSSWRQPEAPNADGPRTIQFIGQQNSSRASRSISAIQRLSNVLRSRIIGQQEAVEAVLASLEAEAVGTRASTRSPISFLMIGPTGTGKTELAKLTAEGLKRPFYRVDMGNFKDKEGLWQLLGSPQGYIGGEGMLTQHVAQNPSSILLFDEIEKGSPEMYDFMLPMLDEGQVKDRKTDRAISFAQTIVFFTSNLITEVPREHAGNQNALRDLVFNARFLRQEFVGRIGQIIPFFSFSPEEMEKITELQLSQYLDSICRNKGLSPRITIDRGVIDLLAGLQSPKYGARNVTDSINQHVEPSLRRALVRHGGNGMRSLKLAAENDQVIVSVD
jgi:ATP-dependent Clp protease ATP-binding subunit ClpA